jgi:hypothetical protein
VIAGAGAAATSAVLGSFFGAMGTVTGAAVGSIASTMVTSIYEHSLNRTQDTVAARLRRRRAAADTAAAAGTTAAAADVTTPMPRIPTGPDGQPTTLLPPAGRPGDPATTVLGGDTPTRQVGGGDQTRRLGTGGGTSPIPPPKRPWGRWVGATVVVFVLGLLVVTGLELLKGSTLTRGQEGTSVGRVLERAPAEDTPTPTTEPTATTEPTTTDEATTTTTEPSVTEESSSTAEPSAESSRAREAVPNPESGASAVPTTTTAEPDN